MLGAALYPNLNSLMVVAAEEALQVEDHVRRIRRELQAPARDALRLVVGALIVEHAEVGRPVLRHLEVEASAEGVFLDVLRVLQLEDVQIGVRGSARQEHRARRREKGPQRGDGRHRARPRRRARHGLHDVPAGVQPVPFVAAEEEGAVLDDRPADGAAELVQLQQRLGPDRRDAVVERADRVEVIARVERVVAQVLEHAAVEAVAARLGDDAHLAAGAGAELGRVAARFDAEFLDVLEARLQLERRAVLAVHIARRGVDDRGTLDAVVLDDVLFVGPAREADVLPGAVARVLRAGRLQQQLRHLAAVDRQALHLALADVGADARRADVEDRRGADDGHRFLHAGRLELEVERQFLADGHGHRRVFDGGEAGLLDLDRVGRWPERADDEDTPDRWSCPSALRRCVRS